MKHSFDFHEKYAIKGTCHYIFSQCRKDDTSLIEYVNFDLNCDVIPSSNSSTQDPFTPDDFFSENSLFQELFDKEDLRTFRSTCGNFSKLLVVDIRNQST